jgi:putative endonuclease
MTHTDFGRYGEDLAEKFLKENGFTILSRNYRCGKNELDFIAQRKSIVSFVEVKTRHGDAFGHPAEAVTRAKQKEMAKAADCYIQRNPRSDVDYRFDIVAIIIRNQTPDFTFIEDAFRLM